MQGGREGGREDQTGKSGQAAHSQGSPKEGSRDGGVKGTGSMGLIGRGPHPSTPVSLHLSREPAQRTAPCREGVRGLWVTQNLALLSPGGCPGQGSGPLWAALCPGQPSSRRRKVPAACVCLCPDLSPWTWSPSLALQSQRGACSAKLLDRGLLTGEST